MCPDCKLIYANADQDAAKQQSQAEAMLTQGVEVLILDAVDAKAAAASSTRPKAQDVPVVAYDRLAEGPVDYYVSFDNEKVGELQGQALLDALDKAGTTDSGRDRHDQRLADRPERRRVQEGRALGARRQGQRSARSTTRRTGRRTRPSRRWQQAITALGKDKIIGVYSANDGMAGGAIAAMKAGRHHHRSPPVTGQDAELAAIQRIVAGDQYMTVYKAIKPEAEKPPRMAVAARPGQGLPGRVRRTSTTARQTSRRCCCTPVAVTDGQHQGHRRQGRLLHRRRDLHGAVRRGVQEGRTRVTR